MTTAGNTNRKPRGKAGAARKPVDDETRAKVVEMAQAGTGRNDIAKTLDIAPSTVTRICQQQDPPISFARTDAKIAAAARADDLKAIRQELSLSVLTEAKRLVKLLSAEHEVIHWDKDGRIHRATIDQPTSGDVKNYSIAIGILADKHLVLSRHDSDDRDLSSVDAWLLHITSAEKVSVPAGWE